jgi:hypothetical protein
VTINREINRVTEFAVKKFWRSPRQSLIRWLSNASTRQRADCADEQDEIFPKHRWIRIGLQLSG